MPAHPEEPIAALARVLDAIEDGIVVYDAAGQPAHVNASMRALLASEAERYRLEEALAEVRRALSSSNGSGHVADPSEDPATATTPPVVNLVLRTSGAEYRLRAAPLPVSEARVDAGVGVVVSVRASVAAHYLTAAELKERYGLTPTEARIASLVEAQLPSAEIARALEISVHTARRHVESVLRKLGIHSRTAVHRKLTGG